MKKKNPKRILLIDDHPIVRHGLTQVINCESDLEVVAEAGSAAEGLLMVEKHRPDLVLVDLTLPDKHGLEFVKDMQAMHPKTRILVLSMHAEELYAERVLRAGARGYLIKETVSDNLVRALRRVLEGGIYVSEKMAAAMLEMVAGQGKKSSLSPLERLTDREIEVLQHIGRGLGTRQVAAQLKVSMRTIDAHRAHIKEKLQLPDGNALVRYAVRWMESQGS